MPGDNENTTTDFPEQTELPKIGRANPQYLGSGSIPMEAGTRLNGSHTRAKSISGDCKEQAYLDLSREHPNLHIKTKPKRWVFGKNFPKKSSSALKLKYCLNPTKLSVFHSLWPRDIFTSGHGTQYTRF